MRRGGARLVGNDGSRDGTVVTGSISCDEVHGLPQLASPRICLAQAAMAVGGVWVVQGPARRPHSLGRFPAQSPCGGGWPRPGVCGCNVTGAREGPPGHPGAPAPEPTPQLPRRHRADHNFMQSRGVGDGTHRGEGLGKVM